MRAYLLGILILVAAGVFARVLFVRWLEHRPFVRSQEMGDVDAGGALVGRAELVPVDVPVLASEGGVDAGVGFDAGPAWTPPPPIEGPSPGAEWATRTRNVLLVGVDRKPWGRGGGLADTIIVAAIDERSGHVGLVSVPRDLYIEFRPGEFGRINTAFHFARENGMSRERYLATRVGELLDLPIEETIIVDLTVLERAVDAVDGVDVDVPCAIRDNFVDPRTDTGRRLLDVPVGLVHMDGVTAAMYARSRHGRSDWDRARRQQAVLLSLRRRVSTFDALPLVPRLLDELTGHVETEMSRGDLLALGRFAMRIDAANMHGLVLSSEASEHFRTPEGSHVLLPNLERIRLQIRDLFEAPAPGIEGRHTRCADVDAALAGRIATPNHDGVRPAAVDGGAP